MPLGRLRKLAQRATAATPHADALQQRYRAALIDSLERLFETLRLLCETGQIYNRSRFAETTTGVKREELAYYAEWLHDLNAEQHLVYSRATRVCLFGRHEASRFNRYQAHGPPEYTFTLVSRWRTEHCRPAGREISFERFLTGVVDAILRGKSRTGAQRAYLGCLDHLIRSLDLVDAYRRRLERRAHAEEDRLAVLERRDRDEPPVAGDEPGSN
jgi:hypothetical protein